MSILLLVLEDVLAFYTLFEVLLVAIYYYLIRSVQHTRGVQALLLLVVYTLLGGVLLLLGVVVQYIVVGSTSTTGCTDLHLCTIYTTYYERYRVVCIIS